MNNITICQKYLICALNEKGKFPAFHTEIPVCFLAGGVLDLMLSDCILVDEDKRIRIVGDLKPEYQHLAPLYEFIKESKPMKPDKLVSEYTFSFSSKRINALFGSVGKSLADISCAVVPDGAKKAGKLCFIATKEAVESVVQEIRAELLEQGEVSEDVVALVSLLEKSNRLKRYFSVHEKEQLLLRLKEIRATPSNKLVKEMVDYMDTMIVVLASISGSAGN